MSCKSHETAFQDITLLPHPSRTNKIYSGRGRLPRTPLLGSLRVFFIRDRDIPLIRRPGKDAEILL
jgi:hypothetical protein